MITIISTLTTFLSEGGSELSFPTVEFSWLGNGTIIAIIAVIHVIISHGVAIGAGVLMVTAEYQAFQQNNQKLDLFAKKMAKWVLIITTTAGAMTGVGIWFSTTVIQPDSIGSLLRIFFWAWVAEWIVFITEVVLLIIYYYTWDHCRDEKAKKKHIKLGITLAIASWLTMAIITGVLAAKLTPGLWTETFSFWHAFYNPTYLPSLGFRMFLAVMLAIALVSFLVRWRIKDQDLRQEIFRIFSVWAAISFPATIILGMWYLKSIPPQAYDLVVYSTGMTQSMFDIVNLTALAIMLLFLGWAAVKPKKVPLILSFAVMGASVGFIGEFEVVRESVRKPFVIYDYMYANGTLAKDHKKFNKDGVLKYSTFSKVKEVTEVNKLEAGREIYKGQCMTCHTVDGWRTKRAFNNRLNGWSEDTIKSFIPTMHQVRPVMPPFAGTDEELDALSAYLYKVVNEKKMSQAMEGKGK